jgi:phenylacetate-CoA ligase
LRGIFTSSETLYSEQKQLIENAFNVPVFDKYGNSEMVTMIGTCEKGNYHDFMEYSFTEILDENGNEVTGENLSGEIISSGFVNPALPLLRYQTGDRVRTTRQACACGRHLTVVRALEGRAKEVIVTRDGSQLPLAPILFGIHDPNWDQIRRIQFVQDRPGELQIRAETINPNPVEVSDYLTRVFSNRLAGQFNFQVQIVSEIPLTPRGKFRYLIRKDGDRANG